MPKDLTNAKRLVQEVESHLTAISGLADVIREDRSYVGSDPSERINECQMDAIHHSIGVLSRIALREFHNVLTELEVPA